MSDFHAGPLLTEKQGRRRPGDLLCSRKVRHQKALAFGKEVTIQTHSQDKYKRTIGDVILPDEANVNQEHVKQGWCWWFRKYAPGDTVLEGLENEARESKKGLWADPQPVPSWEWRTRKRGAR